MSNECFHYNKKMLPASGIELALSFPPVSALLNGDGVSVICSAPVSECWPELGVKSRAVLRRAMVRRRCKLCARLSSGEEDPAGELVVASFPPVSALLNGGGVPVICFAPVSECWPELDVKSQGCPPSSNGSSEVQTLRSPQLRRGGPRQRTGGGALSSGERSSQRRWGSGNLLCSCERMLAGAGREIAGCPPSSDGSSEVQTFALASAPARKAPPGLDSLKISGAA